jgi:hypothetical protein
MLTTLLLPLLWSVVTYTLYALLAVLLFLISKAFLLELSFLYVMKKFTSENKEAVMGKYHPYMGMLGFMVNPAVVDIHKPFAKELADLSDKKMVVYHMPTWPAFTLGILLNQPAVVKEFLTKEIEYTRKVIGADYYPLMNLGFSQDYGSQAIMHKSLYAGFFHSEMLSKLKYRSVALTEKKIPLLIKQHKIDNSKFTEINLRKFLMPIHLSWLSEIVFGCKEESELDIDLTAPECQGIRDHDLGNLNLQGLETVPLNTLLYSFFVTDIGADKDVLDQQCFKLLSKYGLTTKWAKHHLVNEILGKKIISLYNKRYAEWVFDAGKQVDCENIIDVMVHHNKKCLADGNTQEFLKEYDIIGDVMIFMFAGVITSSTTVHTLLLHCVKSFPEWLDKIKAEGVESTDAILNNKSLDQVMREILRVWNPQFSSFRREVIKPMELCGVKIPKGHYIMTPTGWNRDKPHFIDALKFRPERFEEEVPKLEKEQRAAHTPYYEGKRKCLGFPVGELSVKLIVGYMLKMFEFENRHDEEIRMMINVAYEVVDPKIAIKLN